MAPEQHPLRLVIFDLDGVIYRGERPIAGASELTRALREAGVLVRYATNNSTVTREEYARRLGGMAIQAEVQEIVTSTWATIEHLRMHEPGVRSVLVVGERGLADELKRAGFDVALAAETIPGDLDGAPLERAWDACIVGLDRAFGYRSLAAAVAAVRAGTRLIATNADLVYPTERGALPGAGAVVAAVAAGSGVEPAVIGKPEPEMFLLILEAAGVAPTEAVVVGDNPDADIVAAHRAGLRSVLVLTGVADAELAARLEGDRRPDHVAADPDAVGRLLLPWISA